jgi:hypothetical protein
MLVYQRVEEMDFSPYIMGQAKQLGDQAAHKSCGVSQQKVRRNRAVLGSILEPCSTFFYPKLGFK